MEVYRNQFKKFLEIHKKTNGAKVLLFGYNKVCNTWLNYFQTFNPYNFQVLGVVDFGISLYKSFHEPRLNNWDDTYTFSCDREQIINWINECDMIIFCDSGTAWTDGKNRTLDIMGMGMLGYYDDMVLTHDFVKQKVDTLHTLLSNQNQSCYVWEVTQHEIDFYWWTVNQFGAKKDNHKLIWTEGWLYHFNSHDFNVWNSRYVYRANDAANQKRVMWWFNDYSTIKNDKSKNIFILSDKWASGKTTLAKELYCKDSGSYEILATEQVLETLGLNCIGNYNFTSKLDYYNNLDILNETSSSYIIPLQGAYNPNNKNSGSWVGSEYLSDMNKNIRSVSIGSKYQDILGRDYGVDQTLVWVGHSDTNVSQSLRIGNLNKEIRFSGSVDYSTMATSIHNELTS